MSSVTNHPLVRLETLVLIAIGGFAGSNLRYAVGLLLAPQAIGATLVVNALGSLGLGFILYEAEFTGLLSDRTRLIAATGFLSSFTTYSTFAVQTAQLGDPFAMGVNIIATHGLAVAGVLSGRWLAAKIPRGAQ